jgi:D-serine deaminase-like pyridoxal phosphate-dependent protein
MYLMFKRSSRYVLMIVIMAVGMMMSSMGTFASHGTNGLTGYEMNLHDAEVTMTMQDHSRLGHPSVWSRRPSSDRPFP